MFGFGTLFVQWVKTLFKNAQSCVMNNGFSTGYFALERGTRQGDPLSAYLFILATQVAFVALKHYIAYTQKIEQTIAQKNGKLSLHFKKWNPITELL